MRIEIVQQELAPSTYVLLTKTYQPISGFQPTIGQRPLNHNRQTNDKATSRIRSIIALFQLR